MQITFEVKPDGGEAFKLLVGPRQILQWEKRTGGTVQRLQAARMTDLYSLAWVAATMAGRYSGSLESFEATFDLGQLQDEEADPTSPAA